MGVKCWSGHGSYCIPPDVVTADGHPVCIIRVVIDGMTLETDSLGLIFSVGTKLYNHRCFMASRNRVEEEITVIAAYTCTLTCSHLVHFLQLQPVIPLHGRFLSLCHLAS